MKRNDVILFFGSICIIVFAWIGVSIYHASVTSTIEEPLRIHIIGIKPTFDTKTVEKLKQREKVAPLLEGISGIATPSATPSISPAKTPTPSPSIQNAVATPSATPTGLLLFPGNSGTSSL